MLENNYTKMIIGCAIEVHKSLGPGLLESAYKECLKYELELGGFNVKAEQPMPLIYKEIKLDHGYRMDLLIDNKVVVEIKAVEFLSDTHLAQMLTYLKLGNYKLGLLLNFNTAIMKDGIRRVIL